MYHSLAVQSGSSRCTVMGIVNICYLDGILADCGNRWHGINTRYLASPMGSMHANICFRYR